MLCILFLFCSLVTYGEVPSQMGRVSYLPSNAITLLAHNYLDGYYFSDIETGDMIRYYSDEWTDYKVTRVIEAQALKLDTANTPLLIDGAWLTPVQVHRKILNDPDSLVLLTCLYKNDSWTWGRLFVVAERQ
jgi:hypothetical protein